VVYSVFYYATEAITRAVVALIIRVYEHLRRRRMVEERRRREEARPPTWGFFKTVNPYGAAEYTWVGRATNLMVSIPALVRLPVRAHEARGPPTRLYFTFAEAASKDWFREIEWLAEQAEKMARERGAEGAA